MDRRGYWASVNGADLYRLVLDTSFHVPTDPNRFERVVSDPDLDWNRLVDLLAAAGIARCCGHFLDDPLVLNQCPASFRGEIHQFALGEGVKLAETRMVLNRIRHHLEAHGTHGVLLKGASLTVQCWAEGERIPAKTPGDIDLYLPAGKALVVRDALLADGFSGSHQEELNPARHHLEPVTFDKLVIEIHTGISESSWGLPEVAMLQNPGEVADWEPLKLLGPEAYLLHTSVHLGRHFYAFGLKTMWGQLYTLTRYRDDIDWEILEEWANRLRDPRRFWVPVQVFFEDLGFPFPPEFVERAPADWRQHRLMDYARGRFHDLDPSPPPFQRNRWKHEALILGGPGAWIHTGLKKFPRMLGRELKTRSRR